MAERTFEVWQTSELDEGCDKCFIDGLQADDAKEALPEAHNIIENDIRSFSFVQPTDKVVFEDKPAKKGKAFEVNCKALRNGEVVKNADGSIKADINYFVCESGGM